MSAHTLRVLVDNASADGVLVDVAALRVLADNVDKLRAVLLAAKRSHYNCEDSWYSCPLSPEGCSNGFKPRECDCGADKFNAKIDVVLAETT